MLGSLSTSTKQPGQDSSTAMEAGGLAHPQEPFWKLPTGMVIDKVAVAPNWPPLQVLNAALAVHFPQWMRNRKNNETVTIQIRLIKLFLHRKSLECLPQLLFLQKSVEFLFFWICCPQKCLLWYFSHWPWHIIYLVRIWQWRKLPGCKRGT